MSELGAIESYAGGSIPTVYVKLTEADAGEFDWYDSPGVDAPPLPGATVACMEITEGSGEMAAVGVSNKVGVAAPGERRTYGQDSDGVVKSEIYQHGNGDITLTAGIDGPTPPSVVLLADGTFAASHLLWSMEFTPSGQLNVTALGGINLNGVDISALGNLSATTLASLLNNLDTHTHLVQAVPTVPPVPPIPTLPPTPAP